MRSFPRSVWRWLDDRGHLSGIARSMFGHYVPPQVRGRAGWLYVFGTAIVAVFTVQVLTGIALATAYVPSTAHAYDSLQFITHEATLGRLVRGVHYFGASAMVVLVGVHMMRVFLTGSYKFPRELNWLTGVALLALTLGMAFTGQLLRWDSDAVGSVFVAAEQAGRVPLVGPALAHFLLAGETIGAATLSRFFAFHVFFLAGLMFLLIGYHVFLALRAGVSEPPEAGRPVRRETYRAHYRALVERGGVRYVPDAIWREVVVAAAVIAVLVILAIVFGPRTLSAPPDPTNTAVNPRPDWYLLPVFALLALAPHQIEDYLIVLGPVVAGAVLLALPLVFPSGERHPLRRQWSVAVVVVVALGVTSLLYIGQRAPWSPRFDTQPLNAAQLGDTSADARSGSQLFFDKGCQYCHRVAGEGGIRGPDLTHVVSRMGEDEVRARVLTGPPGMPSYASLLEPAELTKIIDFLRELDRPESGK